MNNTFVKGALYMSPTHKTVLRFVEMAPYNNPRFKYVAGYTLVAYPRNDEYGGTVGFGSRHALEAYAPVYHWSDLPTPKDREEAALKVDRLNGKFEGEILRHYAAKRARLRHLTPVMGGEYYAKP